MYKEFELLFKQPIVRPTTSEESLEKESSKVLGEDLFQVEADKEDKKEERTANNSKRGWALRDRLEEVLEIQRSKSQSHAEGNTSLRLIGSNLLEIQEEDA